MLETDIMILIHNSYKNIEEGYHHTELIRTISDNLHQRLNLINDHMLHKEMSFIVQSMSTIMNELLDLQDTKDTNGLYKSNSMLIEEYWLELGGNIKTITHKYKTIDKDVKCNM